MESKRWPVAMLGMHFARYHPAVQPFRKEIPWLHHPFYVIRFHVEGGGENDLESFDCSSRLG